MIVVVDTSPLNYLVLLRQQHVLQLLYETVIVPNAVLTELQDPRAPLEVRTWVGASPRWLKRQAAMQIDQTLTPEMGSGEREAISLALELNADVLLIDELVGRGQAEDRKLVVAGTLAVLLQAATRDYLNLSEQLRHLRSLGFRFSLELEADTLDRFERARKLKRS